MIDGCAGADRRAGAGQRRPAHRARAWTTTPARSSRPGWPGFESLGSICSGGRYDALASDGRTTYPGVGISLGVSRLLVPLLQRGALDATPAGAQCCAGGAERRGVATGEADALAQRLRARGIATEVAASPQKFGKQIRYAERRGIPFVWFLTDEGHQVKDIRSGDQVPADPDSWLPPEADARPRVVAATDAPEST